MDGGKTDHQPQAGLGIGGDAANHAASRRTVERASAYSFAGRK